MAKLPLITVVAPESGPVKIAAVPHDGGGDPKAYYDSLTGKTVVNELVIDSQSAGILKTDVDGNVTASATIAHGEVSGLGDLATHDNVDLATSEVTGVLPVQHGGTGVNSITAGALILGNNTSDVNELVGTVEGQVVKWNDSTKTWYAGTGGGGGGAVNSVSVTAPITNTGTGADPNIGIDQTAIRIAASQVSGLATVATSGSATDITTGTLAKERQEAQGMGGDVSGFTASATVAKIQGKAVSTAAPADGQVLVWSAGSSQWVPGGSASGGSGGGGVTYYLNFGDTDDLGTTSGIPTNSTSAPNAPPYQLGRTSVGNSTTVTSHELGTTSFEHVCSFVTRDAGNYDPNITSIPAGLWDFNIWAKQIVTTGGGSNPLQTAFEVRVYKYSISNVETLLASSDIIYIYDPTVVAQYIAQVNFPQTTILATDRIVVALWAKASTANRAVEFSFNGNTASHCHTTIPSVSGTGLVKVVDGSFQNPASLLVDADVKSDAGIARTKLAASVSADKGKLLMNDASTGAIVAAAYASVTQGGLGTTSNTGASGKILVGSGSSSFAEQTMGGDATIASDGTLTLATLSPAVPTTAKGTATSVATVTLNAKGLVTALTEIPIVLTSTGLPASVVYTDIEQTITGTKIFSGTLTLSSLTASRVLKIDSNKNVTAGEISDGDIATNANIARDKIVAGTNANALLINNSSTKKLDELAISATVGHVLKSNGTAAVWDTIGSTFGSQTLKTVFAAPTVADGTPSFRPLIASDIPELLPKAGGTMTGQLVTAASTTSSAGLNIPHGTIPNTPTNGDLWTTTTGISARINGITQNVSTWVRANTYSAGYKQTMIHSASTAGFNLGTATSNPSSLATGDIWLNNTDFKIKYYSNTTTNVLATEAYVATAVATASGAPYDIAGEAVGAISNNDIVMRFFVTRAFTISAGTNYSTGSCETAPTSSDATFNIERSTDGGSNYSTIGTLTYASGSKSGTITVSSATPLSAGDIVRVKCTAANGIVTPWFTVRGTL